MVLIYHSNMSYQDPRGGYPPPPDNREESQYPPPPGEEDDRARAYHQRGQSAASNVTLPSMSTYNAPYGAPVSYSPDPRAYQQDSYRSPPAAYPDDRAYQPDYRTPPPAPMPYQQSAPRQRTAIACRYCRRRKVSSGTFQMH